MRSFKIAVLAFVGAATILFLWSDIPQQVAAQQGQEGTPFPYGLSEESRKFLISLEEMLARLELESYYGLPPDKRRAFLEKTRAAMNEVLETIDCHTELLTEKKAKRFAEAIKGEFVGIGAAVSPHFDDIKDALARAGDFRKRILAKYPEKSKCGKPPFTSDEEREWNAIDVALKTIGKKGMAIGVLPNSPAERAGLKNGWAILSVDGKSLVGMNINDAVLLIRGEAGTTVTLGIVESPSDASAPNEKRISVVRGAVTIMHVTGKVIETKGAGGGTQKIGYLKIDAFMGDADKQFEKQLAALGVGKLIIDVRGNGGGDARSVYRILKSLLPMNAPTAYFVRKNGDMKELGTIYPSIRALFSLSSTLVFSGKLVVLIDGNSASASEIFAGALRDHKRATLIGEKTFGKGSVQTIYSLPDGTILKLTTALYALPSKEFIDGKGIEPHIKVAETLATGEAGDKVFDAAIAFLAKEKE